MFATLATPLVYLGGVNAHFPVVPAYFVYLINVQGYAPAVVGAYTRVVAISSVAFNFADDAILYSKGWFKRT